MALKYGKPNALNLLDLRRVRFPARHFHYTVLSFYKPTQLSKLDNWIFQSLNGRYYIGQTILLDNNNTLTYGTKVGFEEEKELSFFLLSYSDL